MQSINPALNQVSRNKAFRTLDFNNAVPQEALEIPAVKDYVHINLAVGAATLMDGTKYGNWVRDTITCETLGMPLPRQPEYTVQTTTGAKPRRGKRGGGAFRTRGSIQPK